MISSRVENGTHPVRVASWLGHNVSETFKTYAHVMEDLDPEDKRSAVDMIKAARLHKSRTSRDVKTSPKQSKAAAAKASA